MASFKDLLVWQKAHALSLRVDIVINRIRRARPRLADQLERAMESVMDSIAEGRGRSTDKDFAHYLSISIGSISEVENQLQRVFDLGLMPGEEHASLTEATIEVRKMLIGLRKKLIGDQRP